MKEIILDGTNTSVKLERYSDYLPSQKEILDFEKALGFNLPIDFKEFLLNYNGGVCELKNVIMPISGYLCDLFGLYPDDSDTIFMQLKLPSNIELTELWGELPENLLPIGEVDSGDMIAIRFHPDKSEIVVIDHEEEKLNVVKQEISFIALLSNTVREK
jgi:predicted transcriptional regulator